MIERYTRPEMGEIWTLQNRFSQMLKVEKAVARAQAELNLIPMEAAQAIEAKGQFSLQRIQELEEVTKHDVIAFVSSVAESVGPHGAYVHFGLTSSDVLDTAMSLQVQQAGQLLLQSLGALEEALSRQAKAHAETLCAGRTHGMHAEPTSFGFKMAGHWVEFKRHRERLTTALQGLRIGKLSGAVGTYSTQTSKVEEKVCQSLGLTPEAVATQVIPRDRHAELMCSLALLGAGLERLAVELRHLQRTEVGEVTEGFSQGQKGSSAMPHKKNPISAENITGLSRLLRSYALAALEDVALWHERDISHSSVERVIFPDAFIVCDYALCRMAKLIEHLEIHGDRMKANMDLSKGQLFSSHVLLALVEKGLSREEAYALVQKVSHSLSESESLLTALKANAEVKGLLKDSELDEIFQGQRHRQAISKVIERVLS